MRALAALTSAFQKLNTEQPIKVKSEQEMEFWNEVHIENAAPSSESLRAATQFFGGLRCAVEQKSGEQSSVIKVSKVEIPRSYPAMDVMKYMEETSDIGFFIGIGHFGPVHMGLESLRHAFICGGTGYGKSQFLRFMIAQSLAFHPDVVNHIIDPKLLDFKPYENTPGVGVVAYEKEEWDSLLSALVVESSVRKTFFNRSFSNPPTSLTQYKAFRESSGRTDPRNSDFLPDFPRIICWIDEAAMVVPRDQDVVAAAFCLEYLVRQGRSLGIHIVFSTQRPVDLPPRLVSQAFAGFYFHSNDWGVSSIYPGGVTPGMGEFRIPGIEGRVFASFSETGSGELAQVPLILPEEALSMAKHFAEKRKPTENRGFYRLAMDADFMNSGWISSLIMSGQSLEDAALSVERAIINNQTPPHYKTGSKCQFVYRDIYEPIEYVDDNSEDEFDEERDTATNDRGSGRSSDGSASSFRDVHETESKPVFPLNGERREDALRTLAEHGTVISGGHISIDMSIPLPDPQILIDEAIRKESSRLAAMKSTQDNMPGFSPSASDGGACCAGAVREPAETSVVAISEEIREKTQNESTEDLLGKINDILSAGARETGQEESDESAFCSKEDRALETLPRNESHSACAAKPEAAGLAMPSFTQTNNMKNPVALLSDFRERLSGANSGIAWCVRGNERNAGLTLLRDCLESERSARRLDRQRNTTSNIESLVLPSETQEAVHRYVRLALAATSLKKKAPLLVIYGPPGMGKMTVAQRIATTLGLKLSIDGTTKTGTGVGFEMKTDGSETALALDKRPSTNDIIEASAGSMTDVVEAEKHSNTDKSSSTLFQVFTNPTTAILSQEDSKEISPCCLVVDAVGDAGLFKTEKTMSAADFMTYGTVIEMDDEFYMERGVAARLLNSIVEEISAEIGIASGEFEATGDSVGAILQASSRFAPSTLSDFARRALTLKDLEPQRALDDIFSEMASEIARSKKRAIQDKASADFVVPSTGIEDIKVEKHVMERLNEIIFRSRQAKAYASGKEIPSFLDRNGFGKRVVGLFYGPPGTGKTMAAAVVARESKSSLWKVSLSDVLSKWVGESEANMTKIFKTASSTGAVLLLDEADALLGSREHGGQQHDKRLVNHILTLIESHTGTIILTTNLNGTLDPALARRCDYSIEFSLPSIDTRIEILKSLLKDIPGGRTLDVEAALGDQSFSGGYLKNAIERAIMRAWREGRDELTQKDLDEALREVATEVDSGKSESRTIGWSSK